MKRKTFSYYKYCTKVANYRNSRMNKRKYLKSIYKWSPDTGIVVTSIPVAIIGLILFSIYHDIIWELPLLLNILLSLTIIGLILLAIVYNTIVLFQIFRIRKENKTITKMQNCPHINIKFERTFDYCIECNYIF